MSYEAKFHCVWCNDSFPLEDKDYEERIKKDTLGQCPKCGKFSWCNSIRAKHQIRSNGWKFCYGSASE